MSLRSQGKQNMKQYYDIKMKKLADWLLLFESIGLTLLLMLPIILMYIQLFYIYGHNTISIIIISFIGWFLLMILNGLSNMFQICFAKSTYKDNKVAQELNPKAVFLYQITNIGFAIFTLVLIFACLIMFVR